MKPLKIGPKRQRPRGHVLIIKRFRGFTPARSAKRLPGSAVSQVDHTPGKTVFVQKFELLRYSDSIGDKARFDFSEDLS